MQEKCAGKERILSFDVIRVLAVLAVVMIHCAAYYVTADTRSTGSFHLANLLNSLSRCGAPLFFLLSGALMLREDRKMDIHTAWKRVKPILLLLVAWSVFYAVVTQLLIPMAQGETYSLQNVLIHCLLGHYHLWFLYVLIGLYLITPILQTFVKRENRKLIFYYLVLSALFQFLAPFVNVASNLIFPGRDFGAQLMGQFNMGFVNCYAAYYILGWYLSSFSFTDTGRKWIYALGAAGFGVTLLGAYWAAQVQGTTIYGWEIVYPIESLNILLYSMGIFFALCQGFRKIRFTGKGWQKGLLALSRLSFGVYVIHALPVLILYHVVFAGRSVRLLPVYWLSTAAISYAVAYLMSKIPLLKKLVRG